MKYIFILKENEIFDKEKFNFLGKENIVIFKSVKPQKEWMKQNLTSKAFYDVTNGESKFDDDLNTTKINRLFTLYNVFLFVNKYTIQSCLIIEDQEYFLKSYNADVSNKMGLFVINNRGIDLLFFKEGFDKNEESYFKKSNDKYFRDNEYVNSISPYFYTTYKFTESFINENKIFYKPFEFTLNDSINTREISTFFVNGVCQNVNQPVNFDMRQVITLYIGKSLSLVLFIILIILFYKIKN
jgi:hypothetical protein